MLALLSLGSAGLVGTHPAVIINKTQSYIMEATLVNTLLKVTQIVGQSLVCVF